MLEQASESQKVQSRTLSRSTLEIDQVGHVDTDCGTTNAY